MLLLTSPLRSTTAWPESKQNEKIRKDSRKG